MKGKKLKCLRFKYFSVQIFVCSVALAMVDKTALKSVAYIFINVALLIIYACTFGKDSITKYLDRGLVIIKHEEPIISVNPPGITHDYVNLKVIIQCIHIYYCFLLLLN